MVGTYELRAGLEIFIKEIKKTSLLDMKKIMLAIDSGDIQKEVFHMRKRLDQNGLKEIEKFILDIIYTIKFKTI